MNDNQQNPNKWPLQWIIYWHYKNLEHQVLNYLNQVQHKVIRYIVNLSFWDHTRWRNKISQQRDQYTINDYINKLTNNFDDKKIIRTIFETQLKWHNANKNSSISKQTGLTICYNILESIYPLFGVVGIQPLTDKNKDVFILRYVKDLIESIGSIKLEIKRYPIQLDINSTVKCKYPKNPNINDSDLKFVLSHEFCHQIITKVINDLWTLANKNDVVELDFNTMDITQYPFIQDKIGLVHVHINKLANEIARNTRRGAGNFVITSPVGVSLLQTSKFFTPITKTTSSSSPSFNTLTLMGYINKTIGVYCMMTELPTTKIPFIVGYKGKASQYDSGYTYAPNLLVYPTDETDEDITLSTIDACHTFESEETLLVGSHDYYRLLLLEFAL